MKAILWFYRVLNILSIDVATGAMVCAAFFARIFQIQLRPYGLASLGIAVWVIYSTDHLLDARNLRKEASTNRHLFHQHNFRFIRACVGIAVVIDLIMILYIRKQIFFWGLGLASVIFLYLLFQRRLNPFKELIGALLYSVGVLLPAFSLYAAPISTALVLLVAVFVLTALINMILFSWFDLEHDLKDTQLSVVTFFGRGHARKILVVLFLLQLILLICLPLTSHYKMEALTLFAMNFVLWALFVFSERFIQGDDYRLVGDVIFLFPLPYLLLNG